MSDLQDLIDQWGDGLTLAARAYPETFIAGFLEAARRVANPDFDAIDKSADEYAKLWGFNPSMIRQIMHLGAAQALGITEDE